MKKWVVLVVVLLLVSSSVFAISWVRQDKGHVLVSKCQDQDRRQVQVGVYQNGPNRGQPNMVQRLLNHGDIGQQAVAGGIVNGTLSNGRRFEYRDNCLSDRPNERVLVERTCALGAGVFGLGKYLDTYHVTCNNRCNRPNGFTSNSSWCS